jgi:methionyl-tRNA formyltransferase
MTSPSGLIALVGHAPHAWTMVNALRKHLGDFPVIVERGEPSSAFWARRKRKLGAATVYSMKAAQLAAKATRPISRVRIAALKSECDSTPVTGELRTDVDSLNAEDAIARIRQLAPRAVFVASTGMLRRPLLEACACPVVNYHSGVNPAYRGINGGYFALANGEPEHFGVTLHLVDLGVDTGPILASNCIPVAANDNMQTYMTLMAAKSQDLVVETMARVLAGEAKPLPPSALPSKQYYAPTFGQYLVNGIRRGVW